MTRQIALSARTLGICAELRATQLPEARGAASVTLLVLPVLRHAPGVIEGSRVEGHEAEAPLVRHRPRSKAPGTGATKWTVERRWAAGLVSRRP